jgi:hypothetical protein
MVFRFSPTVCTLWAGMIFLFFFSLSGSAFGQISKNSVMITPAWKVGDSIRYRIAKIKLTEKAGSPETSDTNTYIATVRILEQGDDFFRISWRYASDMKGIFNAPLNFGSNDMSKYTSGELIYRTDAYGTFEGIENWKEVSDLSNELFDIVMKNAAMSGNPSTENAFKNLRNIYSSKEGLEKLVFKEIESLHVPYGMFLLRKSPLKFEEQIPNMMGGKPLRGDAILKVDEVDEDAQTCTVHYDMVLNPEDMKAFLGMFFQKMKLKGDEVKQALKTAKYDIRDQNVFDVDMKAGLVTKARMHRVTIVDIMDEKSRREDILLVECLP